MADRPTVLALATDLDEATFQRLKFRDLRRTASAISFACMVLTFGLWGWDWAIDAAHASATFWLRVLLAGSVSIYPLALVMRLPRHWLPAIFYAMLLWLQYVFLLILGRLDSGAVHGIAGFMYWFIVPPFMSFLLPLRANVAGNIAVVAFPNILVGLLGILPEFELLKYNVLIVPAGAITIFAHVMSERLLRELYRYRWELEWRSVAIDASAGSVLIAQDGVLRFANPRALDQLGRPADQVVGQPLSAFVQDGDRPISFEGLATDSALRLLRGDGSIRWAELHGVRVNWKGAPAVLYSLLDVSERKRAEEDTRIALAQQQELTRLKSQFVSMASHELRTPLAAILSSAQLLQRYEARLSTEERGQLIGNIEAAVARMRRLIEGVLLLGRMESGRTAPTPAALDLETFCQRIIGETLGPVTDQSTPPSRITLRLHDACHRVQLDESLLRPILGNLLSNAVKYSPEGADVDFEVTRSESAVRFAITDRGIGIPSEALPRLFSAFFRADNVGAIAGTGLGLAIVKRAVDAHGGTIAVSSENGVGTRVVVHLPLASGPGEEGQPR